MEYLNQYNLDWRAIATFTGAFVAFYIGTMWKKQKRNELIAAECKEVIGILLMNLASLNHAKELYDESKKKQLLVEFKNNYLNILTRVSFISMTIKDTKKISFLLIMSYLKLLDSFNIEVETMENNIKDAYSLVLTNKKLEKNFNNNVKDIEKYTILFIKYIHPYSIYKKFI